MRPVRNQYPSSIPEWNRAKYLSEIPNQHYSLSREKRNLLFWCAAAAPKEPTFVEIGVCHGGTAMMLAYVARMLDGRYIGIDNWSLEGSFAEVRAHLDQADLLEPRIELIQGDSTTLNPQTVLRREAMMKAVTGPHTLTSDGIDLLLIDGGHQEGVVDRDCANWIPHVKPGGLVCFDDYTGIELPREKDCHWAVRASAELWTGTYETVGYWSGLLVRRKPE